MTAYRFVTLTCDRCFQIFDGGTDRTVREARAHAHAEAGWIQHRRGGDLCGVCAGTHERVPGFEDQVRPVPDRPIGSPD